MGALPRALLVASIAWPLLLGATVWQRVAAGPTPWTAVVYAAASRVCHQRPERSFSTAGVQWPVCARCSGLYLSAPIGALLAPLALARRRRPVRSVWLLTVAGFPTALTWGIEVLGMAEPTNAVRMAAALPLGAAVAYVLVRTAQGAD
jgi:uncharacterized membrane protein